MRHLKTFESYHIVNEDKKYYHQSAMRLNSREQAEIKKLVPDATFEWDDDGPGDSPRQLVWSDTSTEEELTKIISQVTHQPNA